MKNIYTIFMVFAAMCAFSSCDNEAQGNLSRTDYKFFLNATDETREVLEFIWDSRGSSPSLQSTSNHGEGDDTLSDDDDLFTQKGRMYIGAYPSFIIAEVTCRLKREVLDKEKKDNYDLAAGLRCTVTTRDAMGQELRTDHVDCAHAFHGLTLTFDELLEMFGNSNKPYVLRIGIDVENGNSIHIFQDNEEEYGTIVKI